MTARVIPIAVIGDLATSLPVDHECGCSPLDGCCIPPRPQLVAGTDVDGSTDNTDTNFEMKEAGEVKFPLFPKLHSIEEMVWFKSFLVGLRQSNPDGDFYEAIEAAGRMVETQREMVDGLIDALGDIRDAEEIGDWETVNEIIEDFFPTEDFPEVEDVATDDARKFFSILVELHRKDPLLEVRDGAKKALAAIYGENVALPEAESFNADIDARVAEFGEEAVLESLRATFSIIPEMAGLDVADFTIDEFKTFNVRLAELAESMDHTATVNEVAQAAYDDVIAERNGCHPYEGDFQPVDSDVVTLDAQDPVCDCLDGECALAVDDYTDDLTHLAKIIYVYPDVEFTIEEPLYRNILSDGTHVIENDEAGFEMTPGFIAVVLYPNGVESALDHIEF